MLYSFWKIKKIKSKVRKKEGQSHFVKLHEGRNNLHLIHCLFDQIRCLVVEVGSRKNYIQKNKTTKRKQN